jgi:hypothetical protein
MTYRLAYRVYYMNNFLKAFPTRDEALNFRWRHANQHGRPMDDYEILDGSDF